MRLWTVESGFESLHPSQQPNDKDPAEAGSCCVEEAPMVIFGELACLGAAALWALAVSLFAGPIARHGAQAVNLAKCVVAAAVLTAFIVATGGFNGLPSAPAAALGWVAFSGILGLSIGDTALFAAVSRIGPHRSLLLQTFAPVFAALLALSLGERLTGGQILGGLVVLVGVVVVLEPRGAAFRATSVSGVLFGLLGAFGQGSGVVVAKLGMESLPVLEGTVLRLVAGAVGLAVVGFPASQPLKAFRAASSRDDGPRLLLATTVGTVVAMSLMMAGVAWAPASVAAVLLSLPPVFALIFEAMVTRRLPPASGAWGTLIAMAGVVLIVVSQG
jgi:drug/metabolite transporter (DMT)-like permease